MLVDEGLVRVLVVVEEPHRVLELMHDWLPQITSDLVKIHRRIPLLVSQYDYYETVRPSNSQPRPVE